MTTKTVTTSSDSARGKVATSGLPLDKVAVAIVVLVALITASFIFFGEALAQDPEKGSIELWGVEVLRLEKRLETVQSIMAWTAGGLSVLCVASLFVRERSSRIRIGAFALIMALVATALFFSPLKTAFTRKAYFDAADDLHYVVGTKYFTEVGYHDLYVCMAVARQESGRKNPKYMRSLTSNKVRHLGKLVDSKASRRCHASFSDARWASFKRDVEEFEKWPRSRKWSRNFTDHGYNGTPIRTALESPLTNRIEISQRGLCRAGVVDLFLIVGACCLAMWAFGWRVGALLLGLYWVNFLDFSFMGGAFMRYAGIASILAAMSLLKLKHPALAGAVLAVGAGLVIFPVLFFVGATFLLVVRYIKHRKVDRFLLRFLVAGAGALLLLFALSLATGGGFEAWSGFLHQMEINSGRFSSGRVGFVYDFIYPKEFMKGGEKLPYYQDRLDSMGERGLGWLAAPWLRVALAGALVAALCSQYSKLDAPAFSVLIGFSLMFLFLSTMRYYYAGFVWLPLMWHQYMDRKAGPAFLAAFFALCCLGHSISATATEAFVCNTLASGAFTLCLLATAIYLWRCGRPAA
jgi:hypothetical protein